MFLYATTMTLPMLAARPRESATSITPGPQPALMYKESEWAARYPEIERLYVRERRKLRYVIQYMEREHGFKATEQMYKKRIAKWGFQKSSKRSAAAVQTSRPKNGCRKPSPPGELGSMPAIPGFCHHDGLKLMFLTSVRTWSVAFFEFFQSGDGFLVSQQQQPPIDQLRSVETIRINFTFKLVIDLLGRGHGELAGRMARKAFLLVDDMLTLEGPALIWNLLEMMHNMIMLHHVQLFRMLLAHIIALANGRMPEAHPLSTMLRSLRGLVANLTNAASNTSSPSPSFSSLPRSSLTSSNRTMSTADPCFLSRALPSLIEQAWIFNAKILFDHFDPGLIQLYCRIFYDSCSINLPAAIVEIAVQWLSQTEAGQKYSAAAEAFLPDEALVSNPIEEDEMLRRLLAPRMDASPPQDYEMLRASSFAALRERGELILSKGVRFNGNTATLLRILVALVTAKILERGSVVMERSSTARNVTIKVPRIYAGNLACALRTLIDLNIESCSDGIGASWDTVEQIRATVALREYAQGETDPQVVQEMWLLEDALIAAGKYGEAQEIGRDAYRRLEKYVQDIPIGSA